MKAKSAFVSTLLVMLLIFIPTVKAVAAYLVLEGGVNTVEGWNGATNGSSLDITTTAAFDIVGTVYTEPGLNVNLRIGVDKEQDPIITKGTGSFSWNTEGFWEFQVTADAQGVVEVVVHVENVSPLPGRTVYVSAWNEDTSQFWSANVTNGEQLMNLSGGINTLEGWTSATSGSALTIVTETPFDIVGTVYSESGALVNLRIATDKEQDPIITKGTGSFSWNTEGFWEFQVTADAQGTVEVVAHSEHITALPGRVVIVSAWYSGQTAQSWSASISNGDRPVSLNGGINTVEGWNGATNGSSLDITTTAAFDIVGTVYTEPGLNVNLRIGVDKEQDPIITKGTGSFSWNTEGFWEFQVTADAQGVVEVVVHVENVSPLPGRTVYVSAWHGDQNPQTWFATVSNGVYQVFLPIITR